MRTAIGTILFAVILTILGITGANAQNIAAFRNSLARPDTARGSSAIVCEHGSAAEAISRYDTPKPETVTGYRIRIFFDNSQTARKNAWAAKERFDNEFPDIPSYFNFKEPAFIVTVGNCLTKEEAIVLQNKVKKSFPTAFLGSEEEIPVTEFLRGLKQTVDINYDKENVELF